MSRFTKGYYIKQPNMDCQPTEFTALSRHRAVFSWAGKGGIPGLIFQTTILSVPEARSASTTAATPREELTNCLPSTWAWLLARWRRNVHRFNNGKRISQYTCSKYSKIPVGTLCKTQHRINESVVLELVKDLLKAIAEYAKHERAEFVRVVQEAQSSQQTAEVKKQRTRLATAKQRISELEVLLCKIYEDNILGKLSDSRYATLDAQYEKEQKELTAEISTLEKAISDYEKHEKDADRFIALIDKYENFDELTITMLNEFVEKILVHERDRKGSIQTTQEVEIYFNFVGRFVPPKFAEVELTPEELEEIRKREERKDRLHQNYLKRKASGWQRQYEDRTKAKKKAEMDAKKNALRAEDIAKGVFIPVSNMPKLEPKIAPQKGA